MELLTYRSRKPSARKRPIGKSHGRDGNEGLATAVSEEPFIEAVGQLHWALGDRFGGHFEHTKYRFRDLRPQIAERFFPIHQRFRWYPEPGSFLFDGFLYLEQFLSWLSERGPGGSKSIEMLYACGFSFPSKFRTFALLNQAHEPALLLVGLPGDDGYMKTPWLEWVIQSPFKDLEREWRDVVEECWTDTWARDRQAFANVVVSDPRAE